MSLEWKYLIYIYLNIIKHLNVRWQYVYVHLSKSSYLVKLFFSFLSLQTLQLFINRILKYILLDLIKMERNTVTSGTFPVSRQEIQSSSILFCQEVSFSTLSGTTWHWLPDLSTCDTYLNQSVTDSLLLICRQMNHHHWF